MPGNGVPFRGACSMQESRAPGAPSQEGCDAARDTDRLDAGEVGTVSALELLQGSKRADPFGAAHVRRPMLRSMPHIWRIDQVWPQQPVHIMALPRQFGAGGDKSGSIRNVEHGPGGLVSP